MVKNKELIWKIIIVSVIIIIFIFWLIHISIWWKVSKILDAKDTTFQDCEKYIFSENQSIVAKYNQFTNENWIKVLELKCIEKYPNKRDVVISIEEKSGYFLASQWQTIKENLEVPENIILDKSTMSVEFKVPKPNVTFDVSFFWYSIGKIQTRDASTRIWATHDNIIQKSFSFDEIYYQEEETQFIMTNLKWNDIEVNYNIIYYVENY